MKPTRVSKVLCINNPHRTKIQERRKASSQASDKSPQKRRARRHVSGNEPMRAHVVAKQHGEIGFLGVGEIDDVADALFRHPRIARVNIGDHRDLEFAVFRPIAKAGA